MKLKISKAIAAAIAMWAATPAHAGLLISEVLYNEVGSNTGGEWIEIYNTGPGAVDLTNYKIGDEETNGASSDTEGMFQFPAGASIAAGDIQIAAVDASVFMTNYGFLPTYEVTGSNATIPNLTRYAAWDPDASAANTINLSNTNDQVAVLDGADAVVDSLNWGNTSYFNPGLNADAEGDGQSYERSNPLVDTDAAFDWRLGNPSSPGTVPVPEPTGIALALIVAAAIDRLRPPHR